MATVREIAQTLERIAPLELSESWDNVGLLLGDPSSSVQRLMTCLTLTPESVLEAIVRRAEMVISHHPLPFKPLSRITTESASGKLVWNLARAGISVFSAHTAWDSAAAGINAQIAQRLSLQSAEPLIPCTKLFSNELGAGRYGTLTSPTDLVSFARMAKSTIPHSRLRVVDAGQSISKVAIACGSGASLLPAALAAGCDVLLTGEATFHHCLEAKATGVSLVLIGHFASEKFAMDQLAQFLGTEFPSLNVWSSLDESDPVSPV